MKNTIIRVLIFLGTFGLFMALAWYAGEDMTVRNGDHATCVFLAFMWSCFAVYVRVLFGEKSPTAARE